MLTSFWHRQREQIIRGGKLLTESFVNEFLAGSVSCSYCSVDFYPVWYSKSDFSFRLQYVQSSSGIRLEFQVNFNVEDCCLDENGEVDIGNNFEIQGCFIHSDEGCLSADDLVAAKNKLVAAKNKLVAAKNKLVAAKNKLDKGKNKLVICVKGVPMKAIRMMTKDANMGDKKSMGNPQAEQGTQSLPAQNPPSTNKVQEEASFQSEFPNTEVREIWPGDVFKSQKKKQTGGKAEEQKKSVQSGGGKKINKGNASQQQGQVSTKRKRKGNWKNSKNK